MPFGIIKHRELLRAASKMAALHLQSITNQLVSGMLLTGQSGAGKTAFINWYKSCHPDETGRERDIKPIIVVTTPSKPLVVDLAEALLNALGDPLATRGTKSAKTSRILTLLKQCQVELLVFDEFQHFLEHGHAAMLEVTNWLKNLISLAKIPIVLVGLPRCETIIQQNEQMGRRFCRRHYIRPFTPALAKSWSEFRGVLRDLHTRCPVPAVEFHQPDIARRFYYASCGLIDYIVRVINGAIEIAQARKVSIDLDTLGEAFAEVVWDRVTHGLNPFLTEDSQYRLLTRKGEPFELWDKTAPEGLPV